jgi:hypothetical protein
VYLNADSLLLNVHQKGEFDLDSRAHADRVATADALIALESATSDHLPPYAEPSEPAEGTHETAHESQEPALA